MKHDTELVASVVLKWYSAVYLSLPWKMSFMHDTVVSITRILRFLLFMISSFFRGSYNRAHVGPSA